MNLETIETWPRRIFLFAAVAFFISLGCSTIFRANYSHTHRSDFTVYTSAGKAVLDGTNIYEAHNIRGWYFMYLPIFAIVMVPFAWMGTFWASLLWFLLSAFTLIHGIDLACRLARHGFPRMRIHDFWFRALVGLIVLLPATSGIARGQASVLIMYLMTLGIWFYFEKQPWAAGLALAGCIVLKIFPALLALYFLIHRRFKYAATTALWLILLILVIPSAVFGPAKNFALLRQWNTTIAMPANQGIGEANTRFDQMIDPRNSRNQSLQAVAIRSGTGRTMDVPFENEQITRPIALLMNVLLFVVSTWLCFKNHWSESMRRSLLKISMLALLMLMISPVTWNHNFVLVVLPAAAALAAWRSQGEQSSYAVFGWALLVYGAGTVLSMVDVLNYFGSRFWGTILLWTAFAWVLLKDKQSTRQPSERGNTVPAIS